MGCVLSSPPSLRYFAEPLGSRSWVGRGTSPPRSISFWSSSTLTVPHANARVRQQRNSSTSRCDLADVDPSTSTASYAIHCQRRLSRAHDAHLTFYKPSSSPNLPACHSRVLRRSEPARVGKHKTGHHTTRPSHYRYTATTRNSSSLVDESQLPFSPTRLAFPDPPLPVLFWLFNTTPYTAANSCPPKSDLSTLTTSTLVTISHLYD
ncbi:hypothetical protein B0H65DRAFT_25724 [Neurospora tetraspora]|uniref:Ig-like domain-containing protein n=1 Tax=Neurospora tetraspora TaxID=94610 RepID=A0AAE0JNX8_9PEZI|nr:hypothetical protein B0H65DRAFT_25724 [Neurospora tetraspora]